MKNGAPQETSQSTAAEARQKAWEKELELRKDFSSLSEEEKFRRYYEYAKLDSTYRQSEEKQQKKGILLFRSTLATVGAMTVGMTFGNYYSNGSFDGEFWGIAISAGLCLLMSFLNAAIVVVSVTLGLIMHGYFLRDGRPKEVEYTPSTARKIIALLVAIVFGFIVSTWFYGIDRG